MQQFKYVSFVFSIVLGLSVLMPGIYTPPSAYAASASEIDASADESLNRLEKSIPSSKKLLKKAKGVLIFPTVIKAGIGIGGEYGEGVLRINGKNTDYYSTAGVSIGFQLGAQAKTLVILFMTKAALKDFQGRDGWKAGVDGSIAVIEMDAGAAIDTDNTKDPIVAYILGRKGLMYNLTLEGSKFSKIRR
jgi:lipid-binding SYLF domain-containing protein